MSKTKCSSQTIALQKKLVGASFIDIIQGAPLVQCYLFSGGALVFYVFRRGNISPFSMLFLFSRCLLF